MPLVYREFVHEGAELGVWKITETVSELYQELELKIEEEQFYKNLKGDNRVRQWLGSRVLLRKLLNADKNIDFQIDADQKPYLINFPFHISISHSRDYAAVIISETHLVGIDIEGIGSKIERVAHKFLSTDEMSFLQNSDRIRHLYACWTAKEAVYKLYGKKTVSFKENIFLNPFEIAKEGEISAFLAKDDFYKRFTITYREFDSCMLAWVID